MVIPLRESAEYFQKSFCQGHFAFCMCHYQVASSAVLHLRLVDCLAVQGLHLTGTDKRVLSCTGILLIRDISRYINVLHQQHSSHQHAAQLRSESGNGAISQNGWPAFPWRLTGCSTFFPVVAARLWCSVWVACRAQLSG